MQLTESQIKYLRTIQNLKAPVRARDIVYKMQVSKPSVSRMLKQLRLTGLVRLEEKKVIVISPKGQSVLEEHNQKIEQIINYFRIILDVDEKIAEEGAFVLIGNLSQTALNEICRKIEFTMGSSARV